MVDAGVVVAGDGNIGISCDGDQLNLPCFGIDGGNHDNIGATVIIVIAGINAVKGNIDDLFIHAFIDGKIILIHLGTIQTANHV